MAGKSNLRNRIKKQMQKQKLSVPAVARSLELNHNTLYNYLAGRSELKAANLEQLIKILGGKVIFDSPSSSLGGKVIFDSPSSSSYSSRSSYNPTSPADVV